jgi:predicted ABC-type ATPase
VVAPPRLRMFAGPNGSGKTSLIQDLAKEFSPNGLFHIYCFINADFLLQRLQSDASIDLREFGITVSESGLPSSLREDARVKANPAFLAGADLNDSVLTALPETCDAYAAAAVADYIREALLALGRSFAFETVMSNRNKVEFLARAQAAGYRTYLYFIATESSELNLSRVDTRVQLGGHDVPHDKIVQRYQRSLGLVGEALAHAYPAFLFDNSGTAPVWLGELLPDRMFALKVTRESLPAWFMTWIAPHVSV